MTWPDWARLHATVFGLSDPRDADMIAVWIERYFRPDGLRPDDLARATDRMARAAKSVYRSDHVTALFAQLDALRRERVRELLDAPPADALPGPAACKLCSGSGLAAVPHWRADYQFTGDEISTVCTCAAGAALRGRGCKYMGLDEYDFRHPDWRQTQAECRRRMKAAAELTSQAGALDKLLGKILGNLKARESA